VLLDRQVVLAISNNRVVRTLHISSGKASTPTRVGTFAVYSKIQQWWSVPFASWLLWAAPFDGGIAFHEYSPVPATPASHGCVRVTAGNARWLYDFLGVGSQVKVITRSR
jgi:lipoprotein-anchoring transpeptidase ErfK/SrfK